MSWLDGKRRSENVDDRRLGAGNAAPVQAQPGKAVVTAAGVGLLAGLLGWCGLQQATVPPSVTAQVDSARLFVESVLGDVEDTWKVLLDSQYRAPKLVLYTRSTATKGCKTARAAFGPFYCEQDETIYLDTAFFLELQTQACKKMGEPCEVARAYVIAHEWGHHAQKVLGTFARIQRERIPEEGISGASVRVELQADCFAGIWLGRSNQRWSNIKPEFLIAAQQAAEFGGDGPYGPPSHGRADQRAAWMMKGFKGRELTSCDTFAAGAL